jgi:DNA-binding MarR family transcriptional regulator
MNLATIRDTGIKTVAELMVLDSMRDGAVPVTSISKPLKLPISTVSRVMFSLTEMGLVKFAKHPTDRRVRLASLTQKGSKLIDSQP